MMMETYPMKHPMLASPWHVCRASMGWQLKKSMKMPPKMSTREMGVTNGASKKLVNRPNAAANVKFHTK
jgi:hypothetical protein